MFQKVINTTWAAAEMMRNLKQKTLSKLQQFVGFHLLSLNASKPLVDMFGQLGIASACTTTRLKEATSSKEKMKESLDGIQRFTSTTLSWDTNSMFSFKRWRSQKRSFKIWGSIQRTLKSWTMASVSNYVMTIMLFYLSSINLTSHLSYQN